MAFTAVALVLGAVVGLASGGRPHQLAAHSFARWALLPVGVVLQTLPELVDIPGGFALVVLSYACLLAFVVTNLRHVGMSVVLVGLALNALVIAVNAGMPVRGEAIVATGVVDADDLANVDLGAKRHLETDGDRLRFLGDIIPVPVLDEVVSFGDMILAFGAADVVARLLRPRRVRPVRRERSGAREVAPLDLSALVVAEADGNAGRPERPPDAPDRTARTRTDRELVETS